MSLDKDDPADFTKWAETNKAVVDAEHKHLPRTWYGEYLKEKLDAAVSYCQPTIIKEDVQAIDRLGDGRFRVQLKSGNCVVDCVFLLQRGIGSFIIALHFCHIVYKSVFMDMYALCGSFSCWGLLVFATATL